MLGGVDGMSEKARIYVIAVRESDKAIMCDVGRKDRQACWIPKSLIDDDSEVWKAGQSGDLVIPEWFALKEDLI